MKNKISFLILLLGLLSVTTNYAQTNYGENDPLDGTSSALGDANIVRAKNSTVVGTENIMNSDTKTSSFIAGHRNSVEHNYSFALGMSNNVLQSQSGAFGVNNQVKSLNSFALGHSNETNGSFSFALGHTNRADGAFSFAVGRNTTNTKNNSFLIGFDQQQPVFMATKDNTIGAQVGIATDDPQARLDVRLGDKQEIRIQSEMDNTYGGLSFRDHLGGETWRIRAFNNFTGGYNSILSIVSSQKHDLWISAGKTMIGDWFDFDPCSDCDDYELFVKKGIRTQKIKVDLAAGVWADYVFEKDYDLKPLEEVEAFINANGHLPNVPTASEIEKEGLNLGEMDAKLLEKIEELTLYVIELKKEINELKSKN
jgi:hypothetical protein